MQTFTPEDWYWLAEDGRLFSSAAGALVSTEDAAFLAWCGSVETPLRGPTPWPRDDSGAQTEASLQAVLSALGVPLRGLAMLKAYAAEKRWQVETGGLIIAGMAVATDDRSKTMIMGARIKADADPDYSVGWKTAGGQFVTLSAAEIVAISDAVLGHVDLCFAAEAAIVIAIDDGIITSTAAIDAWTWPQTA